MMPIYNYECTTCNHHFEYWHEFKKWDGGKPLDLAPNSVPCECEEAGCIGCVGVGVKKISVPAKLSSYEMGGNGGRYFDRGMGCWVENAAHYKQLQEEKGLVTPTMQEIEESVQYSINEKQQGEKDLNSFLENSKRMSVPEAVDKTFGLDPTKA